PLLLLRLSLLLPPLRPLSAPPFPYTPLFRSRPGRRLLERHRRAPPELERGPALGAHLGRGAPPRRLRGLEEGRRAHLRVGGRGLSGAPPAGGLYRPGPFSGGRR